MNADGKCPVIVLYAPTASGKTAFAIDYFGFSSLSPFKGQGELVSADSQAVYTGMDIGTAKASKSEQKDLPHHLIDIISPSSQFGVGEFVPLADKACFDIFSRKKIPLLAGGSGFYIRNFLFGLPSTPESDPEIRDKVKKMLLEEGKEKLYLELMKVDSESAAKINPNDEYRICRALEVFYTTGKPLSFFALPSSFRKEFDFLVLVLNRPRQLLYSRIDERVDAMFESGLVQEVMDLYKKGYDSQCPGMKAIGYREFFENDYKDSSYEKNFFEIVSEASLDSAKAEERIENIKARIKHKSHRYAKKQQTYVKDIEGALVIDADDKETLKKYMDSFCSKWL